MSRVLILAVVFALMTGCKKEPEPQLEESAVDARVVAEQPAPDTGREETPAPLHVRVRAQQWSWQFDYDTDLEGGGWMSPALVVPAGQRVTLTLTSSDVVHTLYIPMLRSKADAIPGHEEVLELVAPENPITKPKGIQCTEYCGTGHTSMVAALSVLSPEDFEQWLSEQRSREHIPQE